MPGGPGASSSLGRTWRQSLSSQSTPTSRPMRGKEFIAVARSVSQLPTESDWRTAANRAYFAAMIELRDAFRRWGLSAPPHGSVHQLIRKRIYTSADKDMKQIGIMFDRLLTLRQKADYDMGR